MDHAVETLPGIQDDGDDEARIIVHVDMDCFYAACERLRAPELEGKAVIVGMGYEPGDDGGVVATASYEAREFDIGSAQPIAEALERLPRAAVMPADYQGPVGHYRSVDLPYYRSISEQVMEILYESARTIRIASLDEAYLDVTDQTDWEGATEFATALKQRIADEVGVPASIGIGPTRGVSKIASDHDKPDGICVVSPEQVRSFLSPLPLEDLHGVGPVTAEQLHELGCTTIGDVAGCDPAKLEAAFGERGRDLARRARGDGSSVVKPQGKPKSLSRESSLGEGRDDIEVVSAKVVDLAADVATRATAKGAQYRTIGIKVVEPPFEVHTRERTFGGPFNDPSLIEETALKLLDEFEATTIRKVGVRVSNLDFGDEQQALEAFEAEAIEPGEARSFRIDRQQTLTDYE